jgi:tetratricopeptide (TPR) repeat protein
LTSLLKYLGRYDEIDDRLQNVRDRGRLDEWATFLAYYYPSMRRFDDALNMVSTVRDSGDVTWKTDFELSTATWYRQKGDFSSAENVLKDIESSLPSSYRADYDMEWAELEAACGNLDRALELAIKANEQSAGYQHDRNEIIAFLSRLYYAQGRTKDAQNVLAGANGFDNNFVVFYQRAQMAAVTQSPDEDWELSRALLLATRASRGDNFYHSFGEARIYCALASARKGDAMRARREIGYAAKLEPERADIAYYASAAYSLVDDTALALKWLQTAVDRGHQELWWARGDPDLDNLREEPRFQEIMDNWDRRMRALLD